jgi:hypothetical protein
MDCWSDDDDDYYSLTDCSEYFSDDCDDDCPARPLAGTCDIV